MSIHIGAQKGDIAPSILLPGDPMRAKYIAENLLEDAECFNEVRGMLGFTGKFGDMPVSVMGTGMGMPSHSIYVNELIQEYGVTTLVRVGTCGGLQADQKIGDVIIAMASSSTSQMNKLRFSGLDFAPIADFELLAAAKETAAKHSDRVTLGGIISSDTFYDDDPDWWKIFADYGVLGLEMETAELYTLAAKFKVRAMSLLTVSDCLVTGEVATSEQREKGFPMAAKIALETLQSL